VKKKTEKHPEDITVLASYDKETVTLISTYHIDDMRVS
jgi:hypothetical protein